MAELIKLLFAALLFRHYRLFKKIDSEQIEVKNQFNSLINNALKDIAQNDRIILDTDDGVAISCNGSPEDVLFILLTIRDEILKK